MLTRLSILLVLAALLLPNASAQAPSPYQVKAAFLYNFLKFVEWPKERFASASSPYIVGVLGRDPFGDTLDATMRGKNVNGRPISVVRVSARDMARCHLVFISPSEERRFGELIGPLQSGSVLTVSEASRFAEIGGCIEFYMEQNKVRFQINPDAAKRSTLRIHPTLLDLATIVEAQ